MINRYGISANLLMSDLHLCSCEFFLDLWGRSLWGPLFHALRFPVRLRRFVWISPGLWFCDRSEIELMSSRFRCLSPRRLVASNLGRYKAIYSLFAAKLSLFLNLLSWRSGYPCAGLYRHLSAGGLPRRERPTRPSSVSPNPSRDLQLKERKISRARLQNVHELQNSELWKCVEIRTKIRKIQTKIFWNPCKNLYNFCYIHIFSFCLNFNPRKRIE